MLFSSKSIAEFKLNSLDGELGGVKDLLFDDQHWTIRYLVAKTGGWLTSRQVLIPPHARLRMILGEGLINVHLTQQQIQDSPALGSDQPVSRQFEKKIHAFYGWPVYWDGTSMGGVPALIASESVNAESTSTPEEKPGDPHLRSIGAVRGYEIQASDGPIGHVEDFIVDDSTWDIRYLVIDTHKWIPGKKVLISPQWIERVSWEPSTVFVGLSQEAIRNSPEYNDKAILTREYERGLHTHYQQAGYWSREPDGSQERYQEAVEGWDNEGGDIPARCSASGSKKQ